MSADHPESTNATVYIPAHDAAVAFEAPHGCRWCGDEEHHHGSQWHPTAGMHQWTRPTPAQILDRMTARRARRTL